jgi:hypothetical protein
MNEERLCLGQCACSRHKTHAWPLSLVAFVAAGTLACCCRPGLYFPGPWPSWHDCLCPGMTAYVLLPCWLTRSDGDWGTGQLWAQYTSPLGSIGYRFAVRELLHFGLEKNVECWSMELHDALCFIMPKGPDGPDWKSHMLSLSA